MCLGISVFVLAPNYFEFCEVDEVACETNIDSSAPPSNDSKKLSEKVEPTTTCVATNLLNAKGLAQRRKVPKPLSFSLPINVANTEDLTEERYSTTDLDMLFQTACRLGGTVKELLHVQEKNSSCTRDIHDSVQNCLLQVTS